MFEGSGEILLATGEVAVEGFGKYMKLRLDEITDINFEEEDWKPIISEDDPEYIEL